MKTKLIVLTLVVAITVVFLGFAQSSYAQQNTPLMKQKIQQQKSSVFREMMERKQGDYPAIRVEGLIKFLNLSEEQITEINKTLLEFKKDTIAIEKYLEVKDLLTPEQQEKLPLGVPSQIFALEKFSTGRTMNSFCW
jgi:hypothetical protein